MRLSDLCLERRINAINHKTPLLVPSFSSRGFAKIGEIYRKFCEHITDASLVSAYDIHHNLLDKDMIYSSDVLFVDSGGFEIGPSYDLADFHAAHDKQDREWSQECYLKVLRELQPLTSIAAISYDCFAPLSEQIINAQAFFAEAPKEYAKELLIKPVDTDEDHIDIEDIVSNCERIAAFDIIGVTEKELGFSFLSRCQHLVRIRQVLQYHKISIPIHVLGTLDPLSVTAYFMCGADIFDSLSWLRLAYHDGVGVYHNSYALTEGLWTRGYYSISVLASMNNLVKVAQTQALLRKFSRTYDWEDLELIPKYQAQLKSLIGSASVEF